MCEILKSLGAIYDRYDEADAKTPKMIQLAKELQTGLKGLENIGVEARMMLKFKKGPNDEEPTVPYLVSMATKAATLISEGLENGKALKSLLPKKGKEKE